MLYEVITSIAQGALAVTGCAPMEGPGAYYPPSIVSNAMKRPSCE